MTKGSHINGLPFVIAIREFRVCLALLRGFGGEGYRLHSGREGWLSGWLSQPLMRSDGLLVARNRIRLTGWMIVVAGPGGISLPGALPSSCWRELCLELADPGALANGWLAVVENHSKPENQPRQEKTEWIQIVDYFTWVL